MDKSTASDGLREPALQIWADMSPVLSEEGWGSEGPRSLHYFCNVFDSSPTGSILYLTGNGSENWPLTGLRIEL